MAKYNSILYVAALLSTLVGTTAISHAQQPQYFEGIPSTEELKKALKPAPSTPEVRTRQVQLGTGQTQPANPAVTTPPPPAAAVALGKVQFEYNSARLTPEAKQVLQRVAEALKSGELQAYKYQIEGHTDSRGSANYNKQLSERRAQAVKTFLAQAGVNPSRLTAVGRGSEAPYDKEHPDSSVNRRVEVVNLGQ